MEKQINKGLAGKRNVLAFLNSISGRNGTGGKILVRKGNENLLREFKKFTGPGLTIDFVSVEELDRLFPGINHQGVGFLSSGRERQNLDFHAMKDGIGMKMGPILILDRIQDPGNFGNMLRTASCFGVQHVIVSERESCPITPAVEKVSTGAIHFLNIYTITNLLQGLELLKNKGYWIIASGLGGATDWKTIPAPEESVILLGNEQDGIRKNLLDNSDFIYKIPIRGEIESLNVTIACGIFLDRITNRV